MNAPVRPSPTAAGREAIAAATFADEAAAVEALIPLARLSADEARRTDALARRLVQAARAGRDQHGGVDAFMAEYALSTEEGVALMCLAEALLRIPDADTADRFIADKIGAAHWERHLGASSSLFVNASTWGLMLTGKLVQLGRAEEPKLGGVLKRLVARAGEPVVRQAMKSAMRVMGKQFVLGRTIEEALSLAKAEEARGARFSYDMLGEAAMTAADAARYLEAYRHAVRQVSAAARGGDVFAQPSVSVKLSALHPRYEPRQAARVFAELLPRVLALAEAAKSGGIGLTIDAEEAERLDLSLDLFARLAAAPSLAGWDGLGLAVQAYGKRALGLADWLADLAVRTGRKLPVRLVKGAYWDSEIKRAQEGGLEGYPVFTRKAATDASYLACARKLLGARDVIYPQFATHNAHTVAAVHAMAGNAAGYEFQRLHGMGQALYEAVSPPDKLGIPCRVYAPVGGHEDLLAYLVRRLLENGANTSFVNRLADDEAPLSDIVADPVEKIAATEPKAHPRIPLPIDLYRPERANSRGLALWDERARRDLMRDVEAEFARPTTAAPLVSGKPRAGAPKPVTSPHDRGLTLGSVVEADAAAVDAALAAAVEAQPAWDARGGPARAAILVKAADLFEARRARLLGLLIREAGKTLDNAVADLREAVDFLRYYAARAAEDFAGPVLLPGPTGERNELSLHGRGVFAAISPWNFPLAIFTGQVAAALAAGNAVAAKPAEQTPLVAFEAVRLLHDAGVPADVLAFLPGRGEVVGAALTADPRIHGVVFTGSNATAEAIQRALANRGGPIATFIAETGGLNAMIVDSTALPEAAVRDVVRSAFDSAGQRCSAARLLFVQEDVADKLLAMLAGAMDELAVGDPLDWATDVGPVIDEDAREALEAHKAEMRGRAKIVRELALPEAARRGSFVTPAAYEIAEAGLLTREVFGPVLHVVRWRAGELARVCDAVNASGYGLTLGLHTRIEATAAEVRGRVRVGNLYVNRNQIGAVVGSQPFGGEGLSGTGPKAGGPRYLHRFAVERVVATDTTASGGNAALLAIDGG
jgi:RHH-type proline utilization regulon transcriptional repressor/proline dehydrogenase/delta 1-pyrroline-5-carboxylate dehydrogenase